MVRFKRPQGEQEFYVPSPADMEAFKTRLTELGEERDKDIFTDGMERFKALLEEGQAPIDEVTEELFPSKTASGILEAIKNHPHWEIAQEGQMKSKQITELNIESFTEQIDVTSTFDHVPGKTIPGVTHIRITDQDDVDVPPDLYRFLLDHGEVTSDRGKYETTLDHWNRWQSTDGLEEVLKRVVVVKGHEENNCIYDGSPEWPCTCEVTIFGRVRLYLCECCELPLSDRPRELCPMCETHFNDEPHVAERAHQEFNHQ